MKLTFTCLWYLEANNFLIFEIQRIDLPPGSMSQDVYQWFHYNKSSNLLSPLHFQSMDSGVGIEERFFEQGYLKFDIRRGTFIEKYNAAQHQLHTLKEISLSLQLQHAVQTFYANSGK